MTEFEKLEMGTFSSVSVGPVEPGTFAADLLFRSGGCIGVTAPDEDTLINVKKLCDEVMEKCDLRERASVQHTYSEEKLRAAYCLAPFHAKDEPGRKAAMEFAANMSIFTACVFFSSTHNITLGIDWVPFGWSHIKITGSTNSSDAISQLVRVAKGAVQEYVATEKKGAVETLQRYIQEFQTHCSAWDMDGIFATLLALF
eukprot:TRINITY_DN67162_c6_g2_i1.p1 TRINITY_DN67162_c6_g2~~TRINITY_DN67162_c6_g2_i1.p1  ORF type:complete len:200 (-),score=27.37 TRINITY_DN67162_c6_g2_i1:79-678(-)